jgi:hypothetical protein
LDVDRAVCTSYVEALLKDVDAEEDESEPGRDALWEEVGEDNQW